MSFLARVFRHRSAPPSPHVTDPSQRAELIREQTARAEAEAAHRRMAFLAEASTVLSASLDREATLKSVARLVVPYLADWCAIDVLDDDGTIERLAIAHLDPDKERFARQWYAANPIPIDARHGVPNVVRTGKSELWREIPVRFLERLARSPEELGVLQDFGLRSVMIVPLATRDRILGTMTFVTAESGREYAAPDLVLAEDLAQRVALAVDNARLYHEAEAAGQRLRDLQTVTETALVHLALDELLDELLAPIRRVLGTDTAAILLVEDAGQALVVRATAGFEEEVPRGTRVPADRGFAGRIAVEGRPVAVEDVAHLEAPAVRDPRARSVLGAPLRVSDTVIGVLQVGSFQRRRFTEDDIHLLQLLADRVALAVDRARLYQAEQRARRAAEVASRMKDEFLATVSHELRTPLTAILGWARLLRSRRYGLPAEAFGPLETIERNARAQAQLVDDLLDVSRIITGRLRLDLRPIDLATVLDAAVDAVRPAAAAKGVAFDVTVHPSAASVLGDPDRLQQVVWNLLTNAVKFTSHGGHVTVEVLREGGHAHLLVRDTGKGIGKEFLPYIFDRFRQEDATVTRAHGGLGLGLAIVRHLVEMHGGSVSAASAGEGLGSTFTVVLPLQSGEASWRPIRVPDRQPERPEAPPVTAAGLTGYRIVVVDDEVDSRETIAAMLIEHGASVAAASSADEAIELLTRISPDVLVADIGMPGTDGYELIRRVRASAGGTRLRALAVTAYARAEDRERALAAGYDAHVAKPIEPPELAAAVLRTWGASTGPTDVMGARRPPSPRALDVPRTDL